MHAISNNNGAIPRKADAAGVHFRGTHLSVAGYFRAYRLRRAQIMGCRIDRVTEALQIGRANVTTPSHNTPNHPFAHGLHASGAFRRPDEFDTVLARMREHQCSLSV